MFLEQNLIRIEKQPRKNGGPRTIYVCKCKSENCLEIIKIRKSEIKNVSGLCGMHSHRQEPFKSIFNGIKKDWRKIPVLMSYDEYLKMTEITCCHYCDSKIPWQPYGTVNGKFTSRAYFLDRKDSLGPYSVENCVVCCTNCNLLRGNRFTYEEFLLLAPTLKQIRLNRLALDF